MMVLARYIYKTQLCCHFRCADEVLSTVQIFRIIFTVLPCGEEEEESERACTEIKREFLARIRSHVPQINANANSTFM